MYGSRRRIPGSPLTAVFMQRSLCGKHWAQLWDKVDYLDDMQQYYVIWKEVITRSTGKCFLEVMKTQLFSSSWMSKRHILHSDVIGPGSCLRRCPTAFSKHVLWACLLHQATATVHFSLSGQSARAEIFFFFFNAIYMQHVIGYNSSFDTTLHAPLLEMQLPDVKKLKRLTSFTINNCENRIC